MVALIALTVTCANAWMNEGKSEIEDTIMKLSEVTRLLVSAQECNTLESYIDKCGGSLPFDSYYEDDYASKAVEVLQVLYECRNGININILLRFYAGSTNDFYREYGIPRRTLQNWLTQSSNHAEPPQYLLRLILADLI